MERQVFKMSKPEKTPRSGKTQRSRQKPVPPTVVRKRERSGQITKADQILALLKQPSGASLKSIVDATGWQPHSVRGFVSGQLAKKRGLRVESFRRDGERMYMIKKRKA
jgi:hypothetical protein